MPWPTARQRCAPRGGTHRETQDPRARVEERSRSHVCLLAVTGFELTETLTLRRNRPAEHVADVVPVPSGIRPVDVAVRREHNIAHGSRAEVTGANDWIRRRLRTRVLGAEVVGQRE